MVILYVATGVLLLASLIASRRKTLRALKVALRRFAMMAPPFLVMLILVAVILWAIPEATMMRLLARDNRWLGLAGALGLGSVAAMPGFVAFPLCGILRDKGALLMVLSAFSSTLMMVGVTTFPMEKTYLGTRLALHRNVLSLIIAALVAIFTGLIFGELL